jgi:hypothetical protein
MARTILPGRVEFRVFDGLVLFMLMTSACAKDGGTKELKLTDYNGPFKQWEITGDVKEAKTWVESGDSNIIVISKLQKGEPMDSAYSSSVFGYRFQKRHGHWETVFKVKEASQSVNEIVHYYPGSLLVSDLDGIDGAESLFFYSVSSDGGTEPMTLKMIFHWNGKKAPIRGIIPREMGTEGVYKMTLDATLNASPKPIQEFAIRAWRDFVTRKFAEVVTAP